jgi:hypothetical protein
MIDPFILWPLARPQRDGAVPSPQSARRRTAGRRQATDDAGLVAALTARPQDFAAACRAALEDIERSRDGFDAERALREIAIALTDLAGGTGRLDVVVTTRSNRAPATCDAPNCTSHRTRA